MREEFEKLPEISDLVEHFDFSDDTNTYHIRYDDMDDDRKRLDVVYLGGAWYAYQEQQKKIDRLVRIINTGLKIEQSMSDQIHSLKEKIDTAIEYLDSIEGLVWYEQIKGLLK